MVEIQFFHVAGIFIAFLIISIGSYIQGRKNGLWRYLNKVAYFHIAFKVQERDSPGFIPQNEVHLRADIAIEEVKEYVEACEKKNVVEIADALGDQLYILIGTIRKHGMEHLIQDVFDEIHRSNMSKLDEDGEPIFREDGKVLKGPNYEKPRLEEIVKRHCY